ncbi:MAG: hypothetical protein KC912_05195 [Proteobacteria bacterium]|nr:hypothetical protein [Pseudomonadota bacterium]
MILVIAGLHELPFDRLIRSAATLALDGEELVVQRGSSRVEVPGASTFESLPADRLAAAYREARVVVGQASPGVLFDALSVGKRPVLTPRRPELGEHVDDHQVRFAEFVADRAVIVHDLDGLVETVRTWRAEDHRCDPVTVDSAVVRSVGAVIERVARGRRARFTDRLRRMIGR